MIVYWKYSGMCKYNRLYILVEGRDDKEFFDKIVKPEFEKEYGRGRVRVRQYRRTGDERVIDLIEGFKDSNDDYICVADIDKAPCVSGRKREKQGEEFKNVDEDRILIVEKEIESWYLAGLNDDICRRFGFSTFDTTDDFGRGKFKDFQRLANFDSGIYFMREILKHFDIETAKRKNKSFRYFVKKYNLQDIGSVENGT